MKMKSLVDAKRSAQFSSIGIGDKVFVARQNKLKGQTNFDPTEFTVISKRHGTLELLSALGNVITRTITFVRKVPDRRTSLKELMDTEQDLPQPMEVDEPTHEQTSSSGPVDDPPRRSERTKRPPANLRDFIYLLKW